MLEEENLTDIQNVKRKDVRVH